MIKNIIDIITLKKELHLSEKYNFAGPGSDLKRRILNLNDIVNYYNKNNHMPGIVSFKFLNSSHPYNYLDCYCMYHDIYYHIAEQFENIDDKMKLEIKADIILMEDCKALLRRQDINEEQRSDIRMVMGIINLKLGFETNDKCCCLMS